MERGRTSGAQGICTVPVISWIDFSPGIAPTDRFTRKGIASSAAARISSRLYQYASVSHQQKAQARLLLLVVFFAALHSGSAWWAGVDQVAKLQEREQKGWHEPVDAYEFAGASAASVPEFVEGEGRNKSLCMYDRHRQEESAGQVTEGMECREAETDASIRDSDSEEEKSCRGGSETGDGNGGDLAMSSIMQALQLCETSERELRAALYQMQETRQREQRLNEEFIMRREKQQAVELQDLAREHERLRAADAKNFEGQLRVQVDKHRNSHMALQAQIQLLQRKTQELEHMLVEKDKYHAVIDELAGQ